MSGFPLAPDHESYLYYTYLWRILTSDWLTKNQFRSSSVDSLQLEIAKVWNWTYLI
jgi:hypothetical protein